jgi:hypothetical protein
MIDENLLSFAEVRKYYWQDSMEFKKSQGFQGILFLIILVGCQAL